MPTNMEIKLTTTNKHGEPEYVTYRDIDSEADIAGKKIKGCRGYSFYKGKFVIVHAPSKARWTPPGGGIEPGESVTEGLEREIREETNMRVLSQRLIGLIEVAGPRGTDLYTTSACIVEPIGDFVADPDGEITEIKLIDIDEYKSYSDTRLDLIVQRQIERAKQAFSEMA